MAKKPDVFDRVMASIKKQEEPIVKESFEKPKGWLTNQEMSKLYLGDGDKHKRALKEFVVIKKQQLIANGKTEQQANDDIKEYWVRECKVGVAGKVPCASPLAIAEMLTRELIEKLPPQVKKGWLSLTRDIERKYSGPREKLTEKLEVFAEEMKQQLIRDSNITLKPEKAKEIVADRWYGKYMNGKTPGMYVSEEAVKILEDRGTLVKKKDKSFVGEVGAKDVSPGSVGKKDISSKGQHIKVRSGMSKEV